jgi:hypothetical protein
MATLKRAHSTSVRIAMTPDEFLAAVLRNPMNEAIAREIVGLELPDAWLVSGCLVQTVWNVLTGRAVDYGILDYDVFYFDPNTSWEAEDAVIRKLRDRFGQVAIEVRNQARVHLWYPAKHGVPYPPLSRSCEGIDRFLTKNTQVGIRAARKPTRCMRRAVLTISPRSSCGPIGLQISPPRITR